MMGDEVQVARIEEAADIAVGSATIATKAAARVVDAVPVPDPRDNVNFQRLIPAEQRWFQRISPRRNRWPEVADFDARLQDLDARQQRLHDELAELHGRRQRAADEDAAAMFAWMEAGQPDAAKPAPVAQELDDAIAQLSAEHAAIDFARAALLDEKVAYVEKHRKRLVRDAERETTKARDRYLSAIAEVERARDDVVELRQTTVWVSLYPSPSLQTVAPANDLAGGRRKETERHLPGAKFALPVAAILGLLREDAAYVASVSTVEQAAELAGISEGTLTGRHAVWSGSDEDRARRAREREALIAAGGSPVVDSLKLLEAQRYGLPPLGSS